MFHLSRKQVRTFFCDSWRKHREGLVLEGTEATAAGLIAQHLEYHNLLELKSTKSVLEKEFTPEGGQMNPFLHLSLHLAIAEQISIDQPAGIRSAYTTLRQRFEVHDAEHVLMECLGEALWRAQRDGVQIDGAQYLECVKRVV